MMMQPFAKVDSASVSGTFAAMVPQQPDAADTSTALSGDFWYQHLDDFAVKETDPETDPSYFDSILAALVPDSTHLQRDSTDAAATADVNGHLPMPSSVPLQPAAEPLWGPACIAPCAIQSDFDMLVPNAAAIATAATAVEGHAPSVMQPGMAAWSAGDTAVAAAEYHAIFDAMVGATPAPASASAPAPVAAAGDNISAATATGSLTQKLYRTIGDAGSGSSSSTSPAIMKVSPTAAPPKALVPARHSPAPSVGITKPAAAAGVVCDGLALRREANKHSQRRQRYKRQQDMEQIKAQLSELADKHAAIKAKLDSLRSENSALFSRLSSITAKWQGTVALNASLQQENTIHKAEIAGLQQQLAKVQAQLVHQQLQRSQQQWSQAEVWNGSGACWQHQSQGQPHWG